MGADQGERYVHNVIHRNDFIQAVRREKLNPAVLFLKIMHILLRVTEDAQLEVVSIFVLALFLGILYGEEHR